MPTVKVNGIHLYYEVSGQGHPLILIMGLRRNISWWYRQIPELSRHFTVIAFDNRGAGRSDKPVMEYSIGLFADDTAGLMNALGIQNAHVLGISMGGVYRSGTRHPTSGNGAKPDPGLYESRREPGGHHERRAHEKIYGQ